MAVSLSKGGRVSLSKESPLKNIRVGLGWDVNATDTGAQFDLDASAFLLGVDGKVLRIVTLFFITILLLLVEQLCIKATIEQVLVMVMMR